MTAFSTHITKSHPIAFQSFVRASPPSACSLPSQAAHDGQAHVLSCQRQHNNRNHRNNHYEKHQLQQREGLGSANVVARVRVLEVLASIEATSGGGGRGAGGRMMIMLPLPSSSSNVSARNMGTGGMPPSPRDARQEQQHQHETVSSSPSS